MQSSNASELEKDTVSEDERPSTPYVPKAIGKRNGLTFPDDFEELMLPVTWFDHHGHERYNDPVNVLVYLGEPRNARPYQGSDSDSAARKAWAAERQRSLHVKLQVQPGEKFWWPVSLTDALFYQGKKGSENKDVVLGGLAPSIRKVNAAVQPTLHGDLEKALLARHNPKRAGARDAENAAEAERRLKAERLAEPESDDESQTGAS